MSTATVRSADGSTIAVESLGAGRPVILVGGAFNDATTVAGLAATLAPSLQPVVYDRRGRGKSTDLRPDDGDRVAAEVDDLAAVIAYAGEPGCVFGHSSGAILALEAAARGVPIARLAIYEPPYVVADARPQPAGDLLARVEALLAAGDRDGAAALFLTQSANVPPAQVEQMTGSPMWPWFVGLADSLPYDIAVCGSGQAMPVDRLRRILAPTLVLAGGNTEAWLSEASRAVAAAIPGAVRRVVAGQDHGVLYQPDALRPALTEFFA
ncbi:alpha/beta hydrolase [Asanoa sp. WMMD1127]|uniref:alpha/beta fold hydrolase n=1 Tax=Asanoa sp. WMMD1127 TaxID=3016107 RepID=UPI0024162AC3|nr:alpha/beta hydrolase [Asanoa sp. WMMD1127]MDG4821689.1 alpha/beta hydrolase [Asanoa sp. WMMD1127]